MCLVGKAVRWASYAVAAACLWIVTHARNKSKVQTGTERTLLDCIGNTPLLRIDSLCKATNCEILAKAEFLNPTGSIKDRVAATIVHEAEAAGTLRRGDCIVEATAGSTGVALAFVAAARGYRCLIFMPDDVAVEKSRELLARGAEVRRVRPVSIAHPAHMVNQAKAAADCPGTFFADQFENLANQRAHVRTGAEILAQCKHVDGFVCGAGTGGTIAGVSSALKKHNPSTKVWLVDPQGSSLYFKVKRGVLYTPVEAEGSRLASPFDTVTEGVGLNRLTANFAAAAVDDALRCSDQEAVDMAQHLLRVDGLWVGSSSALNCVGAFKMACALGPGHTVVTILCDSGIRHVSKFYDPAYLRSHGLSCGHADACPYCHVVA